ncbi:MAG: carboxypeptidase-like regulatory domain-containing protein [Spirochaetes bacterium]|nr:carboxypeptidase-like regulatory domain-containing protein [Spirochaetota bacterium]
MKKTVLMLALCLLVISVYASCDFLTSRPQRKGSVSGYVNDAGNDSGPSNDSALPGVEVTLKDSPGNFSEVVTADDDGWFKILDVPEGSEYTATYSKDTYFESTYYGIEVIENEDTPLDTMILAGKQGSGSLSGSGVITDAGTAGSFIGGADVIIRSGMNSTDGTGVWAGTTNEFGYYSINITDALINPGCFTMEVTDSDGVYSTEYFPIVLLRGQPHNGLDFSLTPLE